MTEQAKFREPSYAEINFVLSVVLQKKFAGQLMIQNSQSLLVTLETEIIMVTRVVYTLCFGSLFLLHGSLINIGLSLITRPYVFGETAPVYWLSYYYGPFINYVTHLGGGGCPLCYAST